MTGWIGRPAFRQGGARLATRLQFRNTVKNWARLVLLLAIVASASAEVKNLHRVDQHIYRGMQPTPAGFRELAEMGIRTVLDLRGGPIHKPRERKTVENLGMQYVSVRLSGVWEPKDRQIAQALNVLEDPSRWPVFIHCWRGDDRIGMVIACYRIQHDHWTNQQALEEANRLGLHRFEILIRRYIRHFSPGRVNVWIQPPQPAPREPG